MRRILNEPLKGRRDADLTIPVVEDGVQAPVMKPLTPRLLLLAVLKHPEFQVKSLEQSRTLAKFTDSLEAEAEALEEKAKTDGKVPLQDVVEMEDAWWNMVQPQVTKVLLEGFRLSADHVMNALTSDAPKGLVLPEKIEAEPEAEDD